MSKAIDKINKDIDELRGSVRGKGRIRAWEIDVKIGEKTRQYQDPFFGRERDYQEDVVVSLQELIEKILDHCKLSAKITAPVKEKLVVEKKGA